MPCSTRRQRRRVWEQQFSVVPWSAIPCSADVPFQAPIADPEAFARWRTAMEQALRDRIDELRRTEQRLRANLPTAPASDAPRAGGHSGDLS
jgi:hypothetical protein